MPVSRLYQWKILASTNEKNISEQPSLWRKSSKRESCYGDRVYYYRDYYYYHYHYIYHCYYHDKLQFVYFEYTTNEY